MMAYGAAGQPQVALYCLFTRCCEGSKLATSGGRAGFVSCCNGSSEPHSERRNGPCGPELYITITAGYKTKPRNQNKYRGVDSNGRAARCCYILPTCTGIV